MQTSELFGALCVYSFVMARTLEEQGRFVALRTAYNDAFRQLLQQVHLLQAVTSDATMSSEAIEAARRQVEHAEAVYRRSRDALADFVLSGEVRFQVERLAHQLWEDDGRPSGRAEEHWYRAERLIQGEKARV